MLLAVWRAGAPSFQVDSFVREFKLTPSEVFHAGERRSKSRVSKISGFNLTVADTESLAELQTQISVFLDEFRKPIQSLNKRQIESTLDIGFNVGGKGHPFTRSVSFSSSLLREIASLNLELEISAYPSHPSKDD
jgi:hypothetical protein